MGRPTEYSVDDVVECFEPCSEPLTAAEVAEMLGCARARGSCLPARVNEALASLGPRRQRPTRS